jgi:beta-lactamase regulating signal transducer with metallopeptidase domain
VISHLLESTLVLAVAILVARLPRLAARTRYGIVFAALMKFAVPSSLVARVLLLLGFELTRKSRQSIVIEALTPLSAADLPASSVSYWPAIVAGALLAVAAALLVRAFLHARASVRIALANTQPASPRDLAALARARKRAGVASEVHLLRSSSLAAPVTVSPSLTSMVIVIPAANTLSDAELETILTHECAHIARHDFVLGILESLFACVLWFHPLVWLARRMLDAAREEACDAVVVQSGDPDPYIDALGKVCHAAIGPQTAGISCVVNNTIHKRMEAIMRFGTRRLINHRAVIATTLALLVICTLGSGVARASRSTDEPTPSSKYKVNVTATRQSSPDLFVFAIEVRDRATGETVASARVKALPETWATATSAGDHETAIRMIGHTDGSSEVEVTVDHEPPSVTKIIPQPVRKKEKTAHDEDISLDLKDADIRDLLNTFSKLTNLQIIADDDVTGHTTIVMHEVPWPEALEIILRTNNLKSERVGNTIYVHRK